MIVKVSTGQNFNQVAIAKIILTFDKVLRFAIRKDLTKLNWANKF